MQKQLISEQMPQLTMEKTQQIQQCLCDSSKGCNQWAMRIRLLNKEQMSRKRHLIIGCDQGLNVTFNKYRCIIFKYYIDLFDINKIAFKNLF